MPREVASASYRTDRIGGGVGAKDVLARRAVANTYGQFGSTRGGVAKMDDEFAFLAGFVVVAAFELEVVSEAFLERGVEGGQTGGDMLLGGFLGEH